MSYHHWQLSLFFVGLIAFCLIFSTNAFNLTKEAQDDLVTDLPGLIFRPKFRHFSGYLQGVRDQQQLFYWFFESQDQPSTDPLVLWLNGGPGCSSLMGAVAENGPFSMNEYRVLSKNHYAWTQHANVLYIEGPVGVGYSYDKKHHYGTDDDFTARNNLAALKSFLKKFPSFRNRDFYIAGESYGGIYVPTLAKRVLQDLTFKLKGVAIGNGLFNYDKNFDTMIYFSYYHGLVSTRLWKKTLAACCKNEAEDQCRFSKQESKLCQYFLSIINKRISTGLNIYNLYSPCAGGWKSSQNIEYGLSNFFNSSSINQSKTTFLNSKPSVGPLQFIAPCVDDNHMVKYFNNEKVKKALHVRPQSEKWNSCSAEINTNYVRTYSDMSQHFIYILAKKVPMLIYNGDVDLACNYLGNEWFLDNLKLKLKSKYRPWFYTDENKWKQIAGYTKQWTTYADTTLTFATVRGSGHMVPTDRAAPAYKMFSNFLSGRNL